MPWELTEKTPMDKLVDVLTDISGILEDLDYLRSLQEQDQQYYQGYRALLSLCHSISNALGEWEREFRGRLGTYDYMLVGLPLPDPVQDVHFATIHMACMYWAICVLLFSTMQDCGKVLAQTGILDEHTARLAGDAFTLDNIATYARRIAHAIPLLFDNQAGLYGALVSFFPIGVAIQYLTVIESNLEASAERTILLGIMYRQFAGSFVGRFLINLQHRAVSSRSDEGRNLSPLDRARLWLNGSKAGTSSMGY